MANSLFDQLQKSGLVDGKKASQVRKEKHRQRKRQKGAQTSPADETRLRACQTQAEKVARDRELNQQHKEAAGQRAIAAQIRQLIQMNRIDTGDGEIGFNFTDGSKVQCLYVTETLQGQLVQGRLAIVRLADACELVPAAVAEKIKLRDPACIVYCQEAREDSGDADDPYADYQVPDDLMW